MTLSYFILSFVSQTEAVSPQLPADEDSSQSVGQTSINQLGAQGGRHTSQEQRQPRVETGGWELQQPWGRSFQQGMHFKYKK